MSVLPGWKVLISGLLLFFIAALAPDGIVSASPAVPHNQSRLAPAYEHILSFHARARFNADGSMEVQENIEVLAQGNEIRRGIFRTLPLSWNRQDGKIFRVDYRVKSVLRDGINEPYSIDDAEKSVTIRIGSGERLLKPGIYNYEIRYQVSNHFSRFPEWDELYWNVTGNDWAWPVDKASFHLELPDGSHLNGDGRDARLRSIDVYTGVAGAKEQHAEILANGDVQTTRPLSRGEGLTVVYTWPRDILASAPKPEASLPLVHLLLPTQQTSLIWLPLLLIGYYLLWWRKNVTAAGLTMPPVVPLYSLPATLSPGYLRFITRCQYDDVAFSSDILQLVARRGATLTSSQNKPADPWHADNGAEQWLSRSFVEGNPRLDANDKQLLSILFSGKRKTINLSQAHQKLMQNALKELEKRCEAQRPALFRKWCKPLCHCIAIAMLVPVVCGVWFDPEIALYTIPSLLFLAVGLSLLTFLLKCLLNPLKTGRDWWPNTVIFALLGCPANLIGSWLFLFGVEPAIRHPAGYSGALLTAIVLCLFVGWKTPRYTQRGLTDLAVAKGLKRYLKTAEKHRFEVLYPPEQMIAHYENLLPAALALDVGKTWANTFSTYLSKTGAASEAFSSVSWGSIHHFSKACYSSSANPPVRISLSGSSGSGSSGGGSSGGGSGGGGGGGW